MNDVAGKLFPSSRSIPTDHWPTFNVADVAICVGVALMAIDMFTAKRGRVRGVTGATLPPSSMNPPSLPSDIGLGSEAPRESKT
jgi:signal peptidase II